jgi:hypothetical protein
MAMIRGLIESERELRPRYHVVGETTFYQREDGTWFDTVTGKELTVTTFGELFDELSNRLGAIPKGNLSKA